MSSTITALTSGGGLAMAGDTSGQLELKTNNGTTAVTIDTAQNVGIGTASPSEKINAYVASGNNRFLQESGAYKLYSGLVSSGDVEFTTGGTTVPSIVFKSGSGGSYTERMRIDSSGNLLVGTNSQINTGFVCLKHNSANDNGLVIQDDRSVGGTQAVFRTQTTVVGSITTSASVTSYNTSSDYRLKENIAPMTGALATVSALNPVTYTWKSTGENSQGFIAHELQEVVPDCVTGEKDGVETVDDVDAEGKVIGTKEVPKYQGIDTSFLVATLTAAIQEQQAIITDLTTRLEVLEAK